MKPTTKKLIAARIDEKIDLEIGKIAAQEKERTKYNVTKTDIIERALIEFIERYNKGKK